MTATAGFAAFSPRSSSASSANTTEARPLGPNQPHERRGWTFYVKDSRLHYAHNYVGRSVSRVSGTDRLPAGRHQLRFEFEPTGKPDIAQGKGTPGMAQLYVDGQLIAQNEFPLTTPIAFNPGGLTCGANPGSAVTTDYLAPFRFTGTLHTVIIDLSGDLITDTDSEMRMAMSRQ